MLLSGLALSYPGALLAGLLSFASPCILPLVPAYLSFLAGVSFESIAAEQRAPAVTRRVVAAALAFAAGFVIVFVLFGVSATLLGRLLSAHLDLLEKVAGVVVVLFGIHVSGLVRLRPLSRELRFHPVTARAGVLPAFAMGLAFAFGWTPCVGPVLAAILALAGRQTSIWHGAALLACYGAGIGIPFVAAAAAVNPFLRLAARARRYVRAIELTLSALLIATGALMAAGSLASVSGWLLRTFPAFSRIG
ncbi:cytochrome c biogenesis protein CcdA [bacterium]|nr:MAG: cytochrome c biogenesis protein CcdA [bacterium]